MAASVPGFFSKLMDAFVSCLKKKKNGNINKNCSQLSNQCDSFPVDYATVYCKTTAPAPVADSMYHHGSWS